MKKIIILGAGPTGMAISLGLSKKDRYFELYEASSMVGGLGGSEEYKGMVFDYGPHIYHTPDKEMEKFWKDNFGDLLTEKKFFSKNHKDGVLYDYPLSYESIEKFPEKIKQKVKKELAEVKPENVMRAQNFKEVVTAIVGPTLQDLFFETYSKKLWGIPTTEMSAKWAPKRIQIREKNLSFHDEQYQAAGKYGSGAIMNRISEIAKDKGNKIFLNHKVTGLNLQKSKIKEILFENGEKVDASESIVLSTLPINYLSELLGKKNNLEFNSYILAYVVLNKSQALPSDVQSIYFAHDDNFFHRVTEQKQYSDHGYPKNKTILCFEISYRVRPFIEKMSSNELVKTVYKQFCDLGMGNFEDFSEGFTRKFPNINPIMKLGFEEELSKSSSLISSIENLHSVGGAAEFSYGDMQVMFSKARDIVDLLTSDHYSINRNLKVSSPFKFNQIVKVGDYNIGGDNPTLVIAEIGINHQGDKNMASELIDQAKNTGCDYAKIQTYDKDSRVSLVAKSAQYVDRTLSMEENTADMFERLRLSKSDHDFLFNYAKKINMPFISTAFDEKSVDMLMKYDIDAFKIASFDIFNLPLIKYIASKGKPIILSTGMSGMSEIEDALDVIASQDNKNVILLHCVSSYPTDPKDVNLKAINTLKSAFNLPVGYSDHTIGNTVAIASMAMGSHVLEKHFTLNKMYEGSDHVLSATPQDMSEIVEARNTIFSAFGNGIKKSRPVENLAINSQRKSIFSKCDIKKGEVISLENITIKGPGHGLLPKYLPLILGKKIINKVSKDHPITWDDLLDQ